MTEELAGRQAVVKVSGDPIDLSEEFLVQIKVYVWQVSDANKRVIDRDVEPVLERYPVFGNWEDQDYVSVNKLDGTFIFDTDYTGDSIRVKSGNYLPMSTAAYAHSYTYNRGVDLFDVTAFRRETSRTEDAEAGTTETNITITDHGLEVGNRIINTDRGNAERTVTEIVDDDNFTVASVTNQASGDTIELYHYIPSTHRKRMKGQKFASGSISSWDVVDSYFRDALTSGDPVVLEFRGQDSGDPQRVWALLENTEMAAAIDSPQEETVSYISTDKLLEG